MIDSLVIDGIRRNLRYIHDRELKGGKLALYGGSTTCSVNLGTKEDRSIIFAKARCHSKEIFDRRMGRTISRGRLVATLKELGYTVE